MVRAICATSNVCVSRVRKWSPSEARNTWVLWESRRNDFECKNLVAIALVVGAQRVRLAGGAAPLGAVGEGGLLGEHLVLPLLLVFPIHNAHTSSLPRMFPV